MLHLPLRQRLKLGPKWTGPYTVLWVAADSPNLQIVNNTASSARAFLTHFNRVKPYHQSSQWKKSSASPIVPFIDLPPPAPQVQSPTPSPPPSPSPPVITSTWSTSYTTTLR